MYNLEYIIENEQNLEFQISDQLFLETLLMEIRGENYFILIIQKEAK